MMTPLQVRENYEKVACMWSSLRGEVFQSFDVAKMVALFHLGFGAAGTAGVFLQDAHNLQVEMTVPNPPEDMEYNEQDYAIFDQMESLLVEQKGLQSSQLSFQEDAKEEAQDA